MNPSDRRRKLGLERRQVGAREPRRDRVLGLLEEAEDHVDLLDTGAQGCERIDEPLDPVLVPDDLVRGQVPEPVRLVVDDQRALALAREEVEAPVEQHAVVLEGERKLRTDPGETGQVRCEHRLPPGSDQSAHALHVLVESVGVRR